MRLKLNRFLVLLFALISQLALSQEKTISGIVSDASGLPLPGVNVVVKGTTKGVQTDFDGKFKIKAKEGETLVFSFLGMRTIEKSAGANMNVKLSDDSVSISEVVVTAFGIKRNPKDLGYAVSTVKAEDLTENSEPDLSRALSGKVAGVNVNFSTGVAGASNQITIRGISTFSGNSQPLIIVDGIAYDNSQVTSSSQVTGGGGYQSGLASLDPNDIATVNVLKSSAAAALYGSRAVNGVIVVTTKSGSAGKTSKSKLSVNVGLGTYFENISNLPEYQNTYGAGTNFNYANANGSWGPRFDSLATIPTWPTLRAAFPDRFGPTVKYEAKPNNVKDLFRTGLVSDQTFGFNFANQEGGFGLTVSKLNQEGYIPFNNFGRISVATGGNFKIGEKFSFGANLSYSNTDQVGGFFGENQFNGSSSSFARTLYLARNWDLNLPYEDPRTGASVTPNGVQFDHPLWAWEHDQIITDTHRTVLGTNFGYNFNKNITATYRVGYNRYNLVRDEIRDLGSRAGNGLGSLQRDEFTNEDLESTFLVNLNYKLSEDFGLTTILGNNILQNKIFENQNLGTEFTIPKIFTLKNAKNLVSNFDDRSQKRNVGLFADLTFSFRDYFFINATGRNDWSSSLPKDNNSYFYPSVNASFVLTDAFKIDNPIVSYAKLRGGYAKVGRDAAAEFLSATYFLDIPFNSNPLIGTPDPNNAGLLTYADQKLTPEFTNELELGVDLELFNKRAIVDFTYYDKKSTNVITPVAVATSTGFDRFNTNVGELENKGIEIGLTLVPLKSDNFKWTLFTAFTKNKNTVIKIADGVDRFNLLANTPSFAIVGESFGAFYGTRFARDANGNFLINRDGGGIIQAPEPGVIGDPNPDFKVSFTNTIAYKGFSLRGQFDWKQGGDIQSSTIESLLGRGVTKDTEDREKSFIIPGFYGNNDGTPILDASGNQIPNTVQLSANELYFSPAGGNTFAVNSVDEATVYDGTVFRLRELNLTYDFPSKLLNKSPFANVSLSFVGNNLWYFAPNVPKYTNFDPEVTSLGLSRAQGIEITSAPTAKRYGFRINLTF
jgi:TonB-linked SusC/RagA family outer membrane protein